MSALSMKVKLLGLTASVVGILGLSLSYYYQRKRENRLLDILNKVSKYSLHRKSPHSDKNGTHPEPPKERGVALVFDNKKLINVAETVNLYAEIVDFVDSLQKSHSPLAEHIKDKFIKDPESIQIGWIATPSSKSLEQEIINLYGKLQY
jgi:hypothetical protein